MRITRVLLERRLLGPAANEVAREVRRGSLWRQDLQAHAVLRPDVAESVLGRESREMSEVAVRNRNVSRRPESEYRMHVPRSTGLWLPYPRQQRQAPPKVASEIVTRPPCAVTIC